MQSSTPDGHRSRPNYSVQALKPLTKIVSFGPLARKPTEASRRVACRAWSIDIKYRRHGLIATKMTDFGVPKGASGCGYGGVFRVDADFQRAFGRYREISAGADCGSSPERDCADRSGPVQWRRRWSRSWRRDRGARRPPAPSEWNRSRQNAADPAP